MNKYKDPETQKRPILILMVLTSLPSHVLTRTACSGGEVALGSTPAPGPRRPGPGVFY